MGRYDNVSMPRQCLFCPNPVDSAEHIWSDWILDDLKLATAVRITIGKAESVWVDNPEVKIECVCRKCNNGWMSALEEANKFAIRAMINDDPCGLTKRDQDKLTRWAVLKTMVLESCNSVRPLFYTQTEREALKNTSSIPARTLVWLGRFSVKAFHAGGTDAWGEIEKVPKASHSCITTFVVGHLVVQVLTLHVFGQFANQNVSIGCKMGDWSSSLADIWPIVGPVRWPPDVSFTATRGVPSNIATVINRWKIGEDIG